MTTPLKSNEKPIIDLLHKRLVQSQKILARGPVSLGNLKLWCGSVSADIRKIYGAEHEIPRFFAPKSISQIDDPTEELQLRAARIERYIVSIEKSGQSCILEKGHGSRVFIGHGRSLLWRELKDFLSDRLSLQWDEFNREAVAGHTTFERISEMLNSACFAFLIMTAEDQYSNSTTHARQNVVHEVGLFQGRLGPQKAIILLEGECSEFSNIIGLSQIRFPQGHIDAAFEEIRRVLERELII